MSRLSRYVSRVVLSATLIVLLLLTGLDLVFTFLAELEELKQNYQAPQALWYSLLSLPWRLCDMMPVASLIGGIVGLGLLANHSELTVMRAAGVSVWRIVAWVLQPIMLLVILSVAMTEYVVPRCQQLAEMNKAQALGHHYNQDELTGYWQKQDNTFVHIRQANIKGQLRDISFYQLNTQGQLVQTQVAAQAYYLGQQRWQLQSISQAQFAANGSATQQHLTNSIWRSELTPDFLALVTVSPEYLPPSRLYQYAHYLEGQGLAASSYFLEFWKKILAPLAAMSMVFVACSFIFGPLRSVTMGLRIILGILTGLGFRYLQDFSGYASLIYQFSPLIAASVPIIISMCWGIVALRRVK
ncbi:LPS export ABC transporter permease LptG [Agitococcus lubricus]|uniref:Lipopolysaccharide export system permease protein n=1 Tax=Agitococcus lubricus TaxID=1077255 RepID=A0A2T5IYJ4_9GAMM|nr:LPS export ABC transporter permease LptG [Agitococcus lubricus]PTQ89068.1 lipopolysaccharide export system permease protein [Agitococcus lubricus]